MSIQVKDFFKPIQFDHTINENGYNKLKPFIEFAKAISELSYQSVYLVDYYKRSFLYVSDNPIFLCGKSAKKVLEEGYLFYLKNIPEKDLEMLLKINEAGFSFFKTLSNEDRLKSSLSYDFHLIQPGGALLLVNHKLKPLLLDENQNPWIALCLVSASSHEDPGHVYFVNNQSKSTFKLNLTNLEWVEAKGIKLTSREKQILQFSIQGLTMEQMSLKMKVSIDTIKFHKKNIFSKLNVKSITEASAAAMNIHLL